VKRPQQIKCRHCHENIAEHVSDCPVCGGDVGFPNVRAAQTPTERGALAARYRKAHRDAIQRGCETKLNRFEKTVRHSKAVLCRSLEIVSRLLSNDSELYATFHQQVHAHLRIPKNSELDRARLAVDATFFPYYYDEIRFAALSVDGRGLTGYGPCSIVLKDSMIAARTSVFEENTLIFCRRHSIVVGSPPTPGYRATWRERHRVAAAKLHLQLDAQTKQKDFSSILLKQGSRMEDDEFIEVHIYGSLHRKSIERVVVHKPELDEDYNPKPYEIQKRELNENKILMKRLHRMLHEVGAVLETYP
jgi:hypothetical protein